MHGVRDIDKDTLLPEGNAEEKEAVEEDEEEGGEEEGNNIRRWRRTREKAQSGRR